MKSNGQMSWEESFARILSDNGILSGKFYQGLMNKRGISLWGLATQNEPVEVQRWASCEFTGKEEAILLKDFLDTVIGKSRDSGTKASLLGLQ